MKKSQKAVFRADAKKMITSNIHHAGKEMRRRGMSRNQSLVLQLVHFLSVHGRCLRLIKSCHNFATARS